MNKKEAILNARTDFLFDSEIMWSLFNNNSSKPVGSEKTLKDQLLQQEVSCLQHIHEHTTSLLTLLNSTLKSNCPIFRERLPQIEDQLLDGLAAVEIGGENYKDFVEYRSLQKINENKFYKAILEKLEDSKLQLNQRLLKLEDQIQTMESNGYHIYCYDPPYSPVIATITKSCLQKYLALNTIHSKIELLISKSPEGSKKDAPLQKQAKGERKELTVLKLKLKDKMSSEAIEKIKNTIEKVSAKNRVLQAAVSSIREQLSLVDLESRILSNNTDLSFDQIKCFWLSMKKTISKQVLYNANLKHAYRSKSCPSVLQKKKASLKEKDTSLVPVCFLNECRKAFPQKQSRWTKIEI